MSYTSVRERVIKRDGYRCRYCHTGLDVDQVTLDHVVPLSKGGTTTVGNLVVCCGRCNRRKGNSDLSDWFASRNVIKPQKLKPSPQNNGLTQALPLEPLGWQT